MHIYFQFPDLDSRFHHIAEVRFARIKTVTCKYAKTADTNQLACKEPCNLRLRHAPADASNVAAKVHRNSSCRNKIL